MKRQAYRHLKSEAIALRQSGKSYAEIKKLLGIPKSTLSNWLKDVEFSEAVKNDRILQVKQVWARNITEYNKKRHQKFLVRKSEFIEKCSDQVPTIRQRDLFFLFMGLFWGEGSKKQKSRFELVNSDPYVILATIRFLQEMVNVPREKFRCWVHLHPNINPEDAISYWSNVTGIKSEQIRTFTVISRASKGVKPASTLRYGTFHLGVQDAKLEKRVMGWLTGILRQFAMPG